VSVVGEAPNVRKREPPRLKLQSGGVGVVGEAPNVRKREPPRLKLQSGGVGEAPS